MSVWRTTLGVDAKTVVEGIDYDEDAEAIVASGPAEAGHETALRPVWGPCSRLRPG